MILNKSLVNQELLTRQLKDSEAYRKIILDHSIEGFVLVNLTGVILSLNKRAKESIFLNNLTEAREGSNLFDFLDHSRKIPFRKMLNRVSLGESIEYERCFERADGAKAWFEFLLSPVMEKNHISSICIRSRDITVARQSETLYKSLFNNSPLPKLVCDKKTLKFLEVNETAIRHYGFSREEFMEMSAFDVRVKDEHAFLHNILSSGIQTWNKTSVGFHRKKNGDLFAVQVAIHEMDYKGKEAYLILISDVTEVMQLQQALANEKLKKQTENAKIALEAQEKERSTMGKELHDNVNQMLVSVKQFLSYSLSHPDDSAPIIQKSVSTLEECIQEIRRLSRTLVPPSLGDLGLKQAILELIEVMTFNNNSLQHTGLSTLKDKLLEDGLQLAVYRILQEQLTNISKYAEASKIKLAFRQTSQFLLMDIADNGKGFDIHTNRKGIGLNNICNRVACYQGKMEILSMVGKGTTLKVRFPLKASLS